MENNDKKSKNNNKKKKKTHRRVVKVSPSNDIMNVHGMLFNTNPNESSCKRSKV